MGPFRNLISLIQGIDGVNSVSYKDSDRYPQGYRWDRSLSKMPIAKEREIETDYGTLKGIIICSGAGSIDDPMDSYDMILNIYSVKYIFMGSYLLLRECYRVLYL